MGVRARDQSGVRPNDRPIVTGLLITYGLFWIGLAIDRLVQKAGLLPQAELPFAYILRHAFAGVAYHGQLKIMDGAGAVGGKMRYQSPLHKLYHIKGVAGAYDMGAVHQKHGGVVFASGLHHRVRQNGQRRVLKGLRGQRRVQQHLLQVYVVDTLLQRQYFQLCAVEYFKRHCFLFLPDGLIDIF